jgi:hypothetical protein
MIMEDLFEKFYGKPKSEGSSDPPPSESVDRVAQVEQRVGLVETQLLQMAKAQQTILSRLDTMIDQQKSQPAPPQTPPPAPQQEQEPPQVPQQEWRPAWQEPRPKRSLRTSRTTNPQAPSSDDETPIMWDTVNQRLHTMDDVNDDPIDHTPWDDPSQQERPARGRRSARPKRTCTICGRQFPMHKGKMARATPHGPETLQCPECYGKYRDERRFRTIVLVAVGIVAMVIISLASAFGNR